MLQPASPAEVLVHENAFRGRRLRRRSVSREAGSTPAADSVQAVPAAPGTDLDSKLAQLKDLGALKEQGVLSEAEFAKAEDQDLLFLT